MFAYRFPRNSVQCVASHKIPMLANVEAPIRQARSPKAVIPILSQLLKAETADREVPSA